VDLEAAQVEAEDQNYASRVLQSTIDWEAMATPQAGDILTKKEVGIAKVRVFVHLATFSAR
jgi:hypothetical protein